MGVFYYINNYMSKHVVIVYGRFQPPTLAHHMVAQKAIQMAKSVGGDHIIFGSHSEGSEDNPISYEKKKQHMKTVLGTDNVVIDPELKGLGHVLQHLHNKGYGKITLIAGEDRIPGYEKFKEYFGKKTKDPRTGNILDLSKITPENYNVVSAGARDPDADADPNDIRTVSGTKMRALASTGDFVNFKRNLPSHVTDTQARDLMSDVKSGLDAVESEKATKLAAKAAAKAAKAAQKPVKKKNIKETVSAQTRMKLAKAARRTAKRRAMIRKLRNKKRKNIGQLKVRAKNEIKSQLRRRVYKGNWKKLSYNQRANIDKAINKRKPMVDTMVKRIMPTVIRGESDRIRNLNSSYEPILTSDILIEKLVGKKVNRQPMDTEQKVRRRAQNRVNKRAQRNKESNARQAGNFKNNIMVVKSKSGDVEIIDKESYNPNVHEVLISAEKASAANVKQYLTKPQFVNTVTSERLFGYIEGAGDGKTDKKGKAKVEEPKKETSKKSKKEKEATAAPVQPTVVPVKKSSKKDTFPTSHGAGEMEAGIAYSVNTSYGLSPSAIKQKGLIDDDDMKATIANQHQSFMPSCSRVAQAVMKTFPGLLVKHTGRTKTSELTPEAKKNKVKDRTSKADLNLVDSEGKSVAGVSVKIGGASQLTSGSPAETMNFLQWSSLQLGDKMSPQTQKDLESIVDILTKELTGNPRTKVGETGLYLPGGSREGQDEEVNRRQKLHRKITEKISGLLNNDKTFAKYFVYGLLTGHGKFKEGDSGIATHILSANKDGTDSKISEITLDYAEKLIDKIKFQVAFKSSPVETGDIAQKWDEFKERKKQLGEKVTAEDDFRQFAIRSVLRAFLYEDVGFLSGKRLVRILVENLSKDQLSMVVPPEPQSPREAVDYLQDAINYIGDDYYKLFKFLEDSVDITINNPILDFTSIASPQSMNYNSVYVNGKKFDIPVEEPVNYDEYGQESSPITEGKHRNYRKEYDNYHSRPEQRKNRSKRVLARRLMMKLGKVRKGDGKDVDHKDGNPQNNGKSNLRVRGKSENRADND